MDFLLEIVLTIVVGVIIEPLVFFIIGKVKKNKSPFAETKEIVNPKNFIMKYNRDMKGLTWIFGCLLGIPAIGLLIAFPYLYKSNDMSKTDAIVFIAVFAIILFVIVYFLMRIILYKIQIVNGNEILIHTIFKTRKIQIEKIERITETANGGQRAIKAYNGNKQIWKITNAFTNFETAKELLFSLDIVKH